MTKKQLTKHIEKKITKDGYFAWKEIHNNESRSMISNLLTELVRSGVYNIEFSGIHPLFVPNKKEVSESF